MSEMTQWPNALAQRVASNAARHQLMVTGVPESTLLFEALEAEESVAAVTIAGLLPIGEFDEGFYFYLNPDSGEVLFGADWDDEPFLVNATLQNFVEILLWLDSKYPFYSSDASPEAMRSVSDGLRAGLLGIDPSCLNAGGDFWDSFLRDVAIGDYKED